MILSFAYDLNVRFFSLQRTLLYLAGSVAEIYLRKVWNYEKCVVEKTTFKHLLPVKPQHSVFFRVTEYSVIINWGRPSSLATCRFTGLSEVIVLMQAIHVELPGPKEQRD